MTTELITPLGRDINTILATDTPLRIDRPQGPPRIKTVRGGLGTPQNQDNPGSSQLDYTNEPAFGAVEEQKIVLIQEVGNARILFGSMAPRTFAGVADVDPDTDQITILDHGLVTGDGPMQLTTAGTLPVGLGLLTDHFPIVVDDDNFQLALSRQDAQDGTQVDITADGVGNSTISGVHNVSFAPGASLQDGSSGVLLVAGQSLVLPASAVVTLVGDTGAVTTFFFV